jgi:glycosyltransferase involved in cell wall biosynthesis
MGFEHSINLADRVVAVSEKSAEGLRQVCKVTRPIVVRGPLMPDPFHGNWHRDYCQPVDRPYRVTTLARLYVTYLLDAASMVRQVCPNVEFKVYGDGELREELLAKAKQLGLDGTSIFPGAFSSREELTRIMAGTDIFLLSSVLEGQPLVIVEAMAYGCPIVSTNVGGIPELIQDGINGFLCVPERPQCLAEKIIRLINDAELREQLGTAARACYVKSPFETKAVSDYFISVYNEVIEERKK